jgi:hypothetical protein
MSGNRKLYYKCEPEEQFTLQARSASSGEAEEPVHKALLSRSPRPSTIQKPSFLRGVRRDAEFLILAQFGDGLS